MTRWQIIGFWIIWLILWLALTVSEWVEARRYREGTAQMEGGAG